MVRGATRQDGFIPVWTQGERVWLEIAPARLGQPLLLTANVTASTGERGLYASQMGRAWLAEFRRVGNTVQLVARQTNFRADRDPALARAVAQAFSDSLLGAMPVASVPHPESKAVLIEAAFLLGDVAGYSTALETAYRMPFAPDRGNSWFERSAAEPGQTTLAARIHYAVQRIPAPPLVAPGQPQPPRIVPPSTTGDPRSLFVGLLYSFGELPEKAMAPRPADPRVGLFTDRWRDLSDDLRPNPRVDAVNRWRLEKKDPAAELSEPVKPIIYWLDKNIPARYRAAVEAGILEWNKAFERIGFSNAIVVRQQPDDAPWDGMDFGHASVRWFVGADAQYLAIGPSVSDPRSGEILDADIAIGEVLGRAERREIAEDAGAAPSALGPLEGGRATKSARCLYAAQAAAETAFALDLLEARGELDPGSPEAESYVQQVIKATVMHEVGHTLGLSHNFRASAAVTAAQLADNDWVAGHGVAASVMDYAPANLPLQGERPRVLVTPTLGAYDYWAIEYAYKPVAAESEAAELAAVAARADRDPQLALGDDLDNLAGVDPRVNAYDLGDDPLAWSERRIALSQELFARLQRRGARPGDDADRLRRSLAAGFRQLAGVPQTVGKYVGGLYIASRKAGSGEPAWRPVPAAEQRRALRLLTSRLLVGDAFRFEPAFLAAVAPDYVAWERRGPIDVPDAVSAVQNAALDRLLAPGTAERLLDLPQFLSGSERAQALTLAEVYAAVQAAVWSELKSGGAIAPMRRTLQRAHLSRLREVLLRPGGMPADAVALTRMNAVQLQAGLKAALARGGLSVENRAHLQESLGLVTEALNAHMTRN